MFNLQRSALLIIDVINDFEFDGGEALFEQAAPVVEQTPDVVDEATI